MHSQGEWVERYGDRASDYRLPKNEGERLAYAYLMGADGLALLQAVWDNPASGWLVCVQG